MFSHTKVETTKNGALFMPFQGKKKVLVYQGKYLFSMKDRTSITHAFYKTINGNLLITDGVKTIKKVSGFKIIGIATSLLLGLLGIVYIFIVGCIKLVKHKIDFRNHPLFWVFLSILTLLISFVFIATQPFMRMGDMTNGNIILAVGSAIIPIFSVASLFLTIKSKTKFLNSFNFWAILLVLQFSVLLIMNNLLPIIMWK